MKWLYPTKKEPRIKEFGIFDIEAIKWKKFLVGGYYDKINGFKTFKTLKQYIDFLEKNDSASIIFSHNGGRYDFLFLIEYIVKHRKELIKEPLVVKAGKLIAFTITFDDKTIEFRDSLALLPYSLRDLTKYFDVDHKKGEIDYKRIRKITPELLEYLEADCIGLHEVITKFYNNPIIKKSGQAYTTASQALKVFRTFIKTPIKPLSKKMDAIIRESYKGGRVEIFKPYYESKEIKLKGYDINSLYPFVMKDNIYPIKFSYITKNYYKNEVGFYDCVIDVPETYIPVLPIKHNKKLIFPTGRIKGIWAIPEINQALKDGAKIVKINKGYIFEGKKGLFNEYIEEIYNLRKNTKNDAEKTIYKLLMNSLYGRFGLNLDTEEIVIDNGEKENIPYTNFMNGIFARRKKEIDTFNNVAIASYVTSYARLEIYKYLKINRNSVYYCDTDSIYTANEIKTSNELGGLKLVEEVNRACFLQPKTYITDKSFKLKGFDNKRAKEQFKIDEYREALRGSLELIKLEHKKPLVSFKAGLQKGKILAYAQKQIKSLKNEYSKREFIKDNDLSKWDTKALKIVHND